MKIFLIFKKTINLSLNNPEQQHILMLILYETYKLENQLMKLNIDKI